MRVRETLVEERRTWDWMWSELGGATGISSCTSYGRQGSTVRSGATEDSLGVHRKMSQEVAATVHMLINSRQLPILTDC